MTAQSRVRKVAPLDPDSDAGRAAASALSEVLSDVLVSVRARRAAGVGTHPPGSPTNPPPPSGPKKPADDRPTPTGVRAA